MSETVDVGYVHVLTGEGACVEACPHPVHAAQGVWTRTEMLDGETELQSSIDIGEPNRAGNYVIDPLTAARLLREAGYERVLP